MSYVAKRFTNGVKIVYNEIMLRISSVEKGSIAEELGLVSGDQILKINGNNAQDVLDFLFAESKNRVKLLVVKQNGEQELLVCKKEPMEGLGINLEENFCTRECKNKCVFCFIDQLPKGMRKSLYVKDDDYRLSFSEGNYVTLTNCSKDDIKRIKQLKLSPLYVSVHAITPRVRCGMLNNHNHVNVLKVIKKLHKTIEIHAQIVLVPGFNDGEELKKTLIAILPYVKSAAVVPVGLTRYRQGLPKLRAVDKAVALDTLNTVTTLQQISLKWFGERKVQAADEFYILAEQEVPSPETYEGFAQIENGVGMLSKFKSEFYSRLSEQDPRVGERNLSIATGVSSYPTIKKLVECLQQRLKNVNVNVYRIENNFFGHSVTTTGLLVGKDIIEQLRGKVLGNKLLLSSTMLREGTDVFLDDTKVNEVKLALGVEVQVVPNLGDALVDAIVEKE